VVSVDLNDRSISNFDQTINITYQNVNQIRGMTKTLDPFNDVSVSYKDTYF